jgi:hypothetical protein
VAETLELMALADRRTAGCGRLSGGQRRRLDVALALIGDPQLVYVPGIIAFGLIAAAFSNAAVTVVRTREAGIYKRRKVTSFPPAPSSPGVPWSACLPAGSPPWVTGCRTPPPARMGSGTG